MSYNLLNEPWIIAKYIDGHTEKTGIIRVLEDSLKIREIQSPVFHGQRFFMYDFLVNQLLSVIVMCAYTHEGQTDRITYARKLLRDGDTALYTDTVKNYLVRFGDRFDICSPTHPLFQDIRLAKKQAKEGIFPMLNPIAVNLNTFRIGTVRNVSREGFNPTLEEAAYMLMYTASIAQSPMNAKYPMALHRDQQVFYLVHGSNLKETVLLNCQIVEDREPPYAVWEEDYPAEPDPEKVNGSTVYKIYSRAFPVYFFPETDDKGRLCNAVMSLKNEIPADIYKTLSETLIEKNVYSSCHIPKKGDKGMVYDGYQKNDKIWKLCEALLGKGDFGGTIVSSSLKLKGDAAGWGVTIYTRALGTMNTIVEETKRFDAGDITWASTPEGVHPNITVFEKALSEARKSIRKAIRCDDEDNKPDAYTYLFIHDSLAYSQAIRNLEKGARYFWDTEIRTAETDGIPVRVRDIMTDAFDRALEFNSDPPGYYKSRRELIRSYNKALDLSEKGEKN